MISGLGCRLLLAPARSGETGETNAEEGERAGFGGRAVAYLHAHIVQPKQLSISIAFIAIDY
jgi:hypothetical protein